MFNTARVTTTHKDATRNNRGSGQTTKKMIKGEAHAINPFRNVPGRAGWTPWPKGHTMRQHTQTKARQKRTKGGHTRQYQSMCKKAANAPRASHEQR